YEEIMQKINEKAIKKAKKNNQMTNAKRKQHEYKEDEEAWIENERKGKGENPYIGPFKITHIGANGSTITVENDQKVLKRNIKKLKPML
ncbi:hypothetical protein M153_5860002, partial [Pseudoloma neurophilia]